MIEDESVSNMVAQTSKASKQIKKMEKKGDKLEAKQLNNKKQTSKLIAKELSHDSNANSII